MFIGYHRSFNIDIMAEAGPINASVPVYASSPGYHVMPGQSWPCRAIITQDGGLSLYRVTHWHSGLRFILFQLAAAIFGVPAAQAANAVTDCPHASGQPKNIPGGKQP